MKSPCPSFVSCVKGALNLWVSSFLKMWIDVLTLEIDGFHSRDKRPSWFSERDGTIYRNRIQFPEECFRPPTWPPFLCFGPAIWPPWRQAKAIKGRIHQGQSAAKVKVFENCFVQLSFVLKKQNKKHRCKSALTWEVAYSKSRFKSVLILIFVLVWDRLFSWN